MSSTGKTIIGEHSGLAAVMDRVRVVSASSAPILLYGETGTGKELIARAIHDRSPRAGGPFSRVNCGALAPDLVDSELFGHERGAFTGATTQRKGWFERADGGTLFLDEVAELSPAAQVRLLRVVQDGEIVRVGAETSRHVDVRLIAATHRDLAAMVASRAFREDLYYRLAVFPIVLPPLRDRIEDIAPIATYFAARAAERFGLRSVVPTEADVAALSSYRWTGNVRELAAVMDRAVLLGEGRSLDVATALGLGSRTERTERPEKKSISASAEARDEAIEPLDDVVRAHIERALRVTHGRIDGQFGAAKRLGVNPHTLRARMRKMRIDWARFREG